MEQVGTHWTDVDEIWRLKIVGEIWPENSNFIKI
jgi:hypothetical protein